MGMHCCDITCEPRWGLQRAERPQLLSSMNARYSRGLQYSGSCVGAAGHAATIFSSLERMHSCAVLMLQHCLCMPGQLNQTRLSQTSDS